jgi:hypothetical protein
MTEESKNDQPTTEESGPVGQEPVSCPPQAEGPAAEPPKPEPKKGLFTRIAEALAQDERTKELHSVHVRVSGGVVFLDGETKTDLELAAAEEVIRKVEGVRFVQNRLQVNPQARPGGWRDKHRAA